jgi:hypothetical protein
MFTAVATSDALRPAVEPISSESMAVPVPVISPADIPDRIRARKSSSRSGATMNTAVLKALRPSAVASTGLRPTWSDDRPAKRSAARTPPA